MVGEPPEILTFKSHGRLLVQNNLLNHRFIFLSREFQTVNLQLE